MRTALSILAVAALTAGQGTAEAQSTDRTDAQKWEFQLTPRAGFGELRIDRFQGVGTNRDRVDTRGIGIGLGVLTPVGIVAEAGIEMFGDGDLVEDDRRFILKQEFISVGYQFEVAPGWLIVPRVGRTHWTLRRDEDFLFDLESDFGPEDRGNDFFWEASVSRRVSHRVSLGLSYKYGNFDFGRTNSGVFQVTLGF
jgi:hypothetical protein